MQRRELCEILIDVITGRSTGFKRHRRIPEPGVRGVAADRQRKPRGFASACKRHAVLANESFNRRSLTRRFAALWQIHACTAFTPRSGRQRRNVSNCSNVARRRRDKGSVRNAEETIPTCGRMSVKRRRGRKIWKRVTGIAFDERGCERDGVRRDRKWGEKWQDREGEND